MMDEREGHVRRQGARYELGVRVGGDAQHQADIVLVDLSTSGALLEVSRFLKPGVHIDLKIPLEGEPLQVRASVIHCSAHELRHSGGVERPVFRAGVQFIDLPDQGHQLIQDLIIERLQNERREQPRLFVGRAARLEERIELRAVNLGSRGGLFSVHQPLECGREYGVAFRLPNGQVQARAAVRHCQVAAPGKGRFQVGVEFVGFDGNGEETVLEYLRSLDQATRPGDLKKPGR